MGKTLSSLEDLGVASISSKTCTRCLSDLWVINLCDQAQLRKQNLDSSSNKSILMESQ